MRLYEEQDDGNLKLVEMPTILVKKAQIYNWLKQQNLSLEEINFLINSFPEYK